MLQLFANLSAEQANTCSTVLASAGIAYRIRRDPHGWAVWVEAGQYDAAYRAMAAYFRENRKDPFPERGDASAPSSNARFAEALFAALFLFVWHMGFHWFETQGTVVRGFGASAGAIGAGEIYRAVTALMIHADAAHLSGNMLGIIIFGAAVTGETGWGLGWLMILVSGIVGNLVNAAMYQSGHLSIGASTAVFGAIGILAGYQVIRRRRQRGRRITAWAPLAGGLALLGFIGSGENVDIAAHFFGFAVGVGMGAGYALFFRRAPGRMVQAVSLLLVFAVIALAWVGGSMLQN
jgi:membrane associated rhomboid family serine protease